MYKAYDVAHNNTDRDHGAHVEYLKLQEHACFRDQAMLLNMYKTGEKLLRCVFLAHEGNNHFSPCICSDEPGQTSIDAVQEWFATRLVEGTRRIASWTQQVAQEALRPDKDLSTIIPADRAAILERRFKMSLPDQLRDQMLSLKANYTFAQFLVESQSTDRKPVLYDFVDLLEFKWPGFTERVISIAIAAVTLNPVVLQASGTGTGTGVHVHDHDTQSSRYTSTPGSSSASGAHARVHVDSNVETNVRVRPTVRASIATMVPVNHIPAFCCCRAANLSTGCVAMLLPRQVITLRIDHPCHSYMRGEIHTDTYYARVKQYAMQELLAGKLRYLEISGNTGHAHVPGHGAHVIDHDMHSSASGGSHTPKYHLLVKSNIVVNSQKTQGPAAAHASVNISSKLYSFCRSGVMAVLGIGDRTWTAVMKGIDVLQSRPGSTMFAVPDRNRKAESQIKYLTDHVNGGLQCQQLTIGAIAEEIAIRYVLSLKGVVAHEMPGRGPAFVEVPKSMLDDYNNDYGSLMRSVFEGQNVELPEVFGSKLNEHDSKVPRDRQEWYRFVWMGTYKELHRFFVNEAEIVLRVFHQAMTLKFQQFKDAQDPDRDAVHAYVEVLDIDYNWIKTRLKFALIVAQSESTAKGNMSFRARGYDEETLELAELLDIYLPALNAITEFCSNDLNSESSKRKSSKEYTCQVHQDAYMHPFFHSTASESSFLSNVILGEGLFTKLFEHRSTLHRGPLFNFKWPDKGWRFGCCAACAAYHVMCQYTADYTSAQLKEAKAIFDHHLWLQAIQRKYYEDLFTLAVSSTSAKGPPQLYLYTIDAASSHAHPMTLQKPDTRKSSINVGMVGTISAGMFSNVIFTALQWGKGPNVMLTILHAQLRADLLKQQKLGMPIRRKLVLETDNAGGEFKNVLLLVYLAQLLLWGVFEEIEYVTLLRGHTHSFIDGFFGNITRAVYSKERVQGLAESAKGVETVNHATIFDRPSAYQYDEDDDTLRDINLDPAAVRVESMPPASVQHVQSGIAESLTGTANSKSSNAKERQHRGKAKAYYLDNVYDWEYYFQNCHAVGKLSGHSQPHAFLFQVEPGGGHVNLRTKAYANRSFSAESLIILKRSEMRDPKDMRYKTVTLDTPDKLNWPTFQKDWMHMGLSKEAMDAFNHLITDWHEKRPTQAHSIGMKSLFHPVRNLARDPDDISCFRYKGLRDDESVQYAPPLHGTSTSGVSTDRKPSIRVPVDDDFIKCSAADDERTEVGILKNTVKNLKEVPWAQQPQQVKNLMKEAIALMKYEPLKLKPHSKAAKGSKSSRKVERKSRVRTNVAHDRDAAKDAPEGEMNFEDPDPTDDDSSSSNSSTSDSSTDSVHDRIDWEVGTVVRAKWLKWPDNGWYDDAVIALSSKKSPESRKVKYMVAFDDGDDQWCDPSQIRASLHVDRHLRTGIIDHDTSTTKDASDLQSSANSSSIADHEEILVATSRGSKFNQCTWGLVQPTENKFAAGDKVQARWWGDRKKRRLAEIVNSVNGGYTIKFDEDDTLQWTPVIWKKEGSDTLDLDMLSAVLVPAPAGDKTAPTGTATAHVTGKRAIKLKSREADNRIAEPNSTRPKSRRK